MSISDLNEHCGLWAAVQEHSGVYLWAWTGSSQPSNAPDDTTRESGRMVPPPLSGRGPHQPSQEPWRLLADVGPISPLAAGVSGSIEEGVEWLLPQWKKSSGVTAAEGWDIS